MVLLWEWRTGRRNLVWMPFMSLAFFLNGTPREVVANVGARWFLIVIWCLAFVWQVVGGIHFYDTWLFGIGPRKDRGRATSSSDTQATNKAGSFGMAILSDMGIASALRTSQAGLPEPKYDLDFTVFFTIINWLVLSNSAFGVLALPRTVASLCLYLGLPLTFLAYLVAFSSMKALPPAKAYNSPTVFLLMAPFGAGAVARANLAGHLVDDPLAESLMWSSCFAYLFAIYAIGGPLQIWKILQGFGGWTLCFPTATNAVSVMRYMLESGAAANATRGVVGVLAGTSAILTIWMVFMSIRLGFSKKLVDVEFVKAWEEGAHEWALDARGRRHRGQNGSTNGN